MTARDRLRMHLVQALTRSQLPRPDGRLRSRLRTGLVRGLPVCRHVVGGCVVPIPVQRPGLQGELTVAQPGGAFALRYSYQPHTDVLRGVVVAVVLGPALVAREPPGRTIAVRARLVAAPGTRLTRKRRIHVFDANPYSAALYASMSRNSRNAQLCICRLMRSFPLSIRSRMFVSRSTAMNAQL